MFINFIKEMTEIRYNIGLFFVRFRSRKRWEAVKQATFLISINLPTLPSEPY